MERNHPYILMSQINKSRRNIQALEKAFLKTRFNLTYRWLEHFDLREIKVYTLLKSCIIC